MNKPRKKKSLGQHFLTEPAIAEKIARSLTNDSSIKNVLEIGPGEGMLTTWLVEIFGDRLFLSELDERFIAIIKERFPQLADRIIAGNFLGKDLSNYFPEPFSVIGNFPYQISSQILFKVLDNKDRVPEVVGMFQREMAKRVAAVPGNKDYGILSVFVQAYYDVEYLFEIPPEKFSPPPKVHSAVIRLLRNEVANLDCDEKLFRQIVKISFHQRRKMLRKSLKQFLEGKNVEEHFLTQRPEVLSVDDFVRLTQQVSGH